MSFIVEMLQFPPGLQVRLTKRVHGTFDDLNDAKEKGQHEISISTNLLNPIGFRIKNGFGMQVYLWQHGDDDGKAS